MTSLTKSGAVPKLLSGGSSQIPKGDGDGPVSEYIAAMPGWKSAVGNRLDRLIVDAIPGGAQSREVEPALLRPRRHR